MTPSNESHLREKVVRSISFDPEVYAELKKEAGEFGVPVPLFHYVNSLLKHRHQLIDINSPEFLKTIFSRFGK